MSSKSLTDSMIWRENQGSRGAGNGTLSVLLRTWFKTKNQGGNISGGGGRSKLIPYETLHGVQESSDRSTERNITTIIHKRKGYVKCPEYPPNAFQCI